MTHIPPDSLGFVLPQCHIINLHSFNFWGFFEQHARPPRQTRCILRVAPIEPSCRFTPRVEGDNDALPQVIISYLIMCSFSFSIVVSLGSNRASLLFFSSSLVLSLSAATRLLCIALYNSWKIAAN